MQFQRIHPQELRDRGERMYEAGASFAAIGRALDVPPRTVRGWAEADGWRRSGEAVSTPEPGAARIAKKRRRAAGPKQRQQAFDETWDLVLRQHAVVLALPAATPLELARFEGEMRRLTLLIALLSKLAPLLKAGTPSRPSMEVLTDASHPTDLGPLLEAIARRFDAFEAAEETAGVPRDADNGRAPGLP